MLHTIRVTRWPDGVNVPAASISLRFDDQDFGWSGSVTLKTAEAFALLQKVDGLPATMQITIDGFHVNILCENLTFDKEFGATTYTVSGRSPLALFAQPNAVLRTRLVQDDMVASQLVDLELLNSGWTADYLGGLNQLFTTDWLVPGGVWGYQSQSPLDVILQIGAAVGARVYADHTQNIVHFMPQYPLSPWHWDAATPDVTIPLSLVRRYNSNDQNKPYYNQVYVSGQQQGVLVNAVREGEAGEWRWPMVVDKLITAVGAGQERARNILSAVGKQDLVSLELPINAATGVLEPGRLVAIADTSPWRGLVASTSISAAISDNSVHASQSIEVRRHY
jgi:hypothetical protein